MHLLLLGSRVEWLSAFQKMYEEQDGCSYKLGVKRNNMNACHDVGGASLNELVVGFSTEY